MGSWVSPLYVETSKTNRSLTFGSVSSNTNGTVDTKTPTRIEYLGPGQPTGGAGGGFYFPAPQDDASYILADGLFNITQADVIAHDKRYFRGAVYLLPDIYFGANGYPEGSAPTPAEIIGAGSAAQFFCRAGREVSPNNSMISTVSKIDKDDSFNGAGDRGMNMTMYPNLIPGIRYWVLMIPVSHTSEYNQPARSDVRFFGDVNVTGRAVSIITNRQPAKPVITSPPANSTRAAGDLIPFIFTHNDPDKLSGVAAPSAPQKLDLAGFQIQYAEQATVANPNPTWRDLPIANNDATAFGRGWFIDGADGSYSSSVNAGALAVWNSSTQFMPLKCGGQVASPLAGLLPSGDWQLRVRTFDYGHPYPITRRPWMRTNGAYTPDTAPSANVSPWSDIVRLTITSQVLPPQPLAPKDSVAVAGAPILRWRHRSALNPPVGQGGRAIQYRVVGAADWTDLVSGNSTSESYAVLPGVFKTRTRYEWRVRATDTAGFVSDWSEPSVFITVPTPGTGLSRDRPSDSIGGGVLGVGTHRAYIYRRGGLTRVGEALNTSYLEWNRVRDEISTARIVVNNWDEDGGALLAKLQTWAYELVIFRETDQGSVRVWEGPITLLRYNEGAGEVEIKARDVMALAYRRIIRQTMNDTPDGASVVNRAMRVLQNALAPDDPNVLAHMQVFDRPDVARQYRNIPGYSRTAYEEVDDMASNSGLDYTVAGRMILLWGTKNRIGTLPEFDNTYLSAAPIITEYGMSFANGYAVSDGQGNYGSASRLDVSGNDLTYGLVEVLSSSWASDTPAEAGTYTQAGLATIIESFKQSAERSISDKYPPPVLVRVPDGTTLNPDTPVGINDFVPGVIIPLRVVGRLRSVRGNQKLDSLRVVETSGAETISITLSPYNRDDDAMDFTDE